jgi:hypothetical protein
MFLDSLLWLLILFLVKEGLFSYNEKKELLSNLKNEELTLISKIEDMIIKIHY